MRYKGTLDNIKEIEKELKKHTMALLKKDKEEKKNWFNTHKTLYTKRFDVLIPNNLFGTNDYIFSLSLIFNERDGEGSVRVKDKDIWWLLRTSHRILQIVAQMKPIRGG